MPIIARAIAELPRCRPQSYADADIRELHPEFGFEDGDAEADAERPMKFHFAQIYPGGPCRLLLTHPAHRRVDRLLPVPRAGAAWYKPHPVDEDFRV